MNPLSIFPNILFLGPLLAPFLVRMIVSLFIIKSGIEKYKKSSKWEAIVHFLCGAFLFLGLYTQVAVLFGLIIIAFTYYTEKKLTQISSDKKMVFLFASIILLSLLFTGPGFFAFDLAL